MVEASATTVPEGGVPDALTREPKDGIWDDFGMGLLNRILEKYYRFFDVPFQKLLGTLEIKSIFVQVDILATDLPCSIRRESGRPGSEYDLFTNQHVADTLQLCENEWKPEVHADAFSSRA